MKIVACMPCRNEDWVLGLSARVALLWCDTLILYVHASTDRSWAIACALVEEYGVRVCAIHDDEPIWDEMQHRQRMLTAARQAGATHIAIVDADEILTGNLIPAVGRVEREESYHESRYWGIRQKMEEFPSNSILQLPGYNLRGGLHQYHASGIWGNRWFSVVFKDDARLGWSGDKFHAREPKGMMLKGYQPIAQGQGGVMHLWGASERRLRAKHAWYKVTERLRFPEKSQAEIETMYNWAIKGRQDSFLDQPCQWKFKDVPNEWWSPYEKWIRYLNVDGTPWQEQAVRDAVAKHGAERFRGLDLFGVEK